MTSITDSAAPQNAMEETMEQTIRRVLDTRLVSLRDELRGEIYSALARVAQGETAVAVASPALASLNRAVAGILQPTGQSDIMAALLLAASEFAGRCALFVRRGDSYSFWRGDGLETRQAALRPINIPASDPGIFKEVSETRQPFASQTSPETLPPALLEALGDSEDKSVYLFPITVQGKVVAALYADAGEEGDSVEPSALEILSRLSGLSLETAAARGRAQSQPAAAPAPEPPPPLQADAPPEPQAAVGQPPPEEAPAIPVEETVEQPGEQPREEEVPQEALAAAPDDGSRGSFAFTVSSPMEGEPVIPLPPEADSLPEEERDIHRKAHRFARVAVQDLFSYHRAKIEEARKDKNLYKVLREDIEKCRQNYQSRFGQTPARSFDYLHYELVVKLAGNDLSVLGDQYPGPHNAE